MYLLGDHTFFKYAHQDVKRKFLVLLKAILLQNGILQTLKNRRLPGVLCQSISNISFFHNNNSNNIII